MWSDWSSQTSFITSENRPPQTPLNQSPLNGQAGIELTTALQATVFDDPDAGQTHLASQWQLRLAGTSEDFSQTLLDTGASETSKTSLLLSEGLLSPLTTYWWRVRYQDSVGQWSSWSQATSFKTQAPGNDKGTVQFMSGSLVCETVIDSERRSIYVRPGQDITGLLRVNVNNSIDTRLAVPLVGCADWMARASSFWVIQPSLTGGQTNVEATLNLTAPDEVGDYHLAVVFDAVQPEWLISNTDPSLDPAWFDSNDVLFDWSADQLEAALLDGAVMTRRKMSTGWQQTWVGATVLDVHVLLAPYQPVNLQPQADAEDVDLVHQLVASDYFDPQGRSHEASHWQLRVAASPGDYSQVLYDSSSFAEPASALALSAGLLNFSTTYLWRVRYQNIHGVWSPWSEETAFTTAGESVGEPPEAPQALSPQDAQLGVSVTPLLKASAFSDPDVGDFMTASQWRVRAQYGSFDQPVVDSGIVADNTGQYSVSESDALEYNTVYYWQVRYRDSRGLWSEWSSQSQMCTVASALSLSAPVGLTAHGGARSVMLRWDLHDDPRVAAFNLYRSPAGAADYAALTPSPLKSTEYFDTAVTPGLEYDYILTALSVRCGGKLPVFAGGGLCGQGGSHPQPDARNPGHNRYFAHFDD